jgi:hypothetical protein
VPPNHAAVNEALCAYRTEISNIAQYTAKVLRAHLSLAIERKSYVC